MAFGINRKVNLVYRNATVILFVVLVLFLISVDTVLRYFELLSLNELQNSTVYAYLRMILFAFLSLSILLDNKILATREYKILLLFLFLTVATLFIYSSNISELARSLVYVSTFILIYRYSFRLSINNTDTYIVIRAIIFSVIILIILFLQKYLFDITNIYIISNDSIFSLVVFMPFIFLYRNKKVMILLLLLLVLSALFSQKRSVFMSVIIVLFIVYNINNPKIKNILITLASLILVNFYLNELIQLSYIENIYDRFSTASDGGRQRMNEEIIYLMADSDLIQFFFGHGYLATIDMFGIPSHNDFTEILYDFGIIPLILHVLVIILFGYYSIHWFRQRGKYLNYYLCYNSAYFLLIGLSLFNNMIFSIYNVILFFALGYSRGHILKIINNKS